MFSSFVEAATMQSEPGQQAVDGSAAVGDHADNGQLGGVRYELIVQPGRVRDPQYGRDLGPVGDRLHPGPRPRRWREPAGYDLACPLESAALGEAQGRGRGGEMR